MRDLISSQNSQMERLLENMREQKQREQNQRYYHENPVAAITGIIERQIKDFESNLQDGYELGAWLASFGNQILIIVEEIQFAEPALVIFHGRDDQDNKLQLIQHASQLNLLLNAVKKNNDVPRKPIGFVHD